MESQTKPTPTPPRPLPPCWHLWLAGHSALRSISPQTRRMVGNVGRQARRKSWTQAWDDAKIWSVTMELTFWWLPNTWVLFLFPINYNYQFHWQSLSSSNNRLCSSVFHETTSPHLVNCTGPINTQLLFETDLPWELHRVFTTLSRDATSKWLKCHCPPSWLSVS